MLNQNAYSQYKNNKILTASPAELTLMLYEGAIKFCNIAVMAINNKEIEKAHNNIVKVEKIVQNFRDTLDKNYPVWEEFEKVYVYLLRRLHEANVGKDTEILEEILTHLRSLRDNWKEVMKTVNADAEQKEIYDKGKVKATRDKMREARQMEETIRNVQMRTERNLAAGQHVNAQ